MRSILLRAIRDLWRGTLGWTVAIAGASSVTLVLFPSIQGLPHLDELFGALPPTLQALAGGPEAVGSVTGFLKIKVIENLPLLFSIFAIMHAADAIAGEEERGTLELLLAHPVARWKLIVGKFAVIAFALTFMGSAVATGLAITVARMEMAAGSAWIFGAVMGAIPVALLFGAVALLGSSRLRHARSAGTWAAALLGASYLLHLLAPMSAALQSWSRLSPVHEFLRQVPWNGPVPVTAALGPLTLTVLLTGVAVAALARRDVGG